MHNVRAFIFAQSRGGWVSLGASLLIMNIIFIKKRILKKNSIFIFFFIAVLFFGFLSTRSSVDTSRITQPEQVLTLNGRLDIWQGALQMVKDRLFRERASGILTKGSIVFGLQVLTSGQFMAHNEYLQMAAENGVPDAILMIFLFIAVLIRGLRKSPDFVITGCCCGVLSLCLHGWTDFNFHIPQICYYLLYGRHLL